MADPSSQDCLSAALAARMKLLSGGAQSVTINGVAFTLLNLDSLEKLIDKLRAEIAADLNAAATGSDILMIGTRFR